MVRGALQALAGTRIIIMNPNVRNWHDIARVGLVAISILLGFRARALEPETLFNFQLGVGTVTGTLIQGPDGNFYGTTPQGGLLGSGTLFRVTPEGVLTNIASDLANPAAGLIVGNDG